MKHKVLLLGLGFWGKFWIDVINKTNRCDLIGIAGSEEEVNNIVKEHNYSKNIAFTDYKKAIEKTNSDIAIIVLPACLHFDAASLALKSGMNVIMEKPLAMDIEEAQKLLEVKKECKNQKFMVSQNYRWRLHNQAIKTAIQDGKIGSLENILVEFRKQEDLQGYRKNLEQPLLQDVCIHHFDLIRFFTGKNCEEIYCRSYRPTWSEFEGRPNTEALIKMEDGINVNYNGTWAARGKETSWDGNFVITGSKGCITLDENDNVYLYEFKKNQSVVMVQGAEKGELIQKSDMKFTEMEYGFNMFMDCIENDEIPETTLEDNFNSFAMVSAALQSVEQSKVVKCKKN
jgi:predicted dehydrogenase